MYGEPLCQRSSVVATLQGVGFQPQIFEVIPSFLLCGESSWTVAVPHRRVEGLEEEVLPPQTADLVAKAFSLDPWP